MRVLLPVVLLAFAGLAAAAPPPAVQREATALIDALGASGCRLERNGTWYDAAHARDHLRRKYEALAARDALPTTEAFIDRAGSRSSMSGRDYHVRCGTAAPTKSAAWLRARLAGLRAGP